MQFKEIIGQSEVKNRLIQMYENQHIPHAMLFTGQEGAGALSLAIAYAQYLNCEHAENGDSCGECMSCRQFAQLSHPDLHFVFPIIKKTDGSGDSDMFLPEWREMFAESHYFSLNGWLESLGGKKSGVISKDDALAIHKKLSFSAYEGRYQIVIIWHPELMNDSASNKILKILEEPPEKTLFILVAEDSTELLPTIQSRVQSMKIAPIDESSMVEKLVAEGIETERAKRIAHVSCGSYLRAREIIDNSDEMQENLIFFMSIMRTCYSRNVFDMIRISNEVKDLSRDTLKNRLNYSQNMLRENFVMNLGNDDLVFLTDAERDFSKNFAPFIHINNIFALSESITEALAHIEQNGNERIVLMDLMMKMAVLLKTQRPE